MSSMLSLFIDISVLFCLGFTIFYAIKLSNKLNNFRASRGEFESVIRELSANIDKAYEAIDILKAENGNSGQDLQVLLDRSRDLKDELQLMNDAGNSLAKRLESLAEKNSRIVRGEEETESYDEQLYDNIERLEKGSSFPSQIDEDPPSFFIQDRDVEGAVFQETPSHLQSESEKELYRALQQNKKRGVL